MIRIAFVGCAHIHTPGFAELVAKRPDVETAYTWDPDPARATARAADLGAKAVRSRKRIWDDGDVAAVVICSETRRHRRLVREAVDAGKPLFVEKPLGMKARDAREMAGWIAEAGLPFQTGYMMRCRPAHRFLRDETAAGHLGTVTRARMSNCHRGSLAGWFDEEWAWMADPKQAGVGAYGDLGTHGLDLLMWLLGDVTEATGVIQAVTGRYGECDESGEGLLRFASGAAGTLAAGWVDLANPATLEVSGTEGHAAILKGDLYYTSKHVEKADGKTPWTDLPPALDPPLALFLDAVGGKADVPLVPVEEAASRVAVMEAIYQGAARRRWVKPAG